MNASTSFLTSKGMVIAGLVGAVAYFLVMKHWQHVLEFFPYLVFLACPLMHIFMHGKHGAQGGNNDAAVAEKTAHSHNQDTGKKPGMDQNNCH
jgi:hypothetical protein